MSGNSQRRAAPAIPRLPAAPSGIRKGASLKRLLDREAVECLADNLRLVHPRFDARAFRAAALHGIRPLQLMQRGRHIAAALRAHLPARYAEAIELLLACMTPPLSRASGNGLAVFYYLPYSSFIAYHGQDRSGNAGRDPFAVSMRAQHELTRRFTAEFSIRPFLIRQPGRTLAQLRRWVDDEDEHVRRLCCEGTRPRLPWGQRIPAFIKDPRPTLPLLESLKDDGSLYVRRSVANHLGDIAKDHRALALAICRRWLRGASDERRWLVRHALRYPASQGDAAAVRLRAQAGARQRRAIEQCGSGCMDTCGTRHQSRRVSTKAGIA